MFSFVLVAGISCFQQGRMQNGDVPVFGSIKTLVMFSSI
jgi:hypothetical protein